MSGLAAYPGDPCYDPSRPSWLPYSIDDIQEAECETGTSNWWSAGWSELGSQAAGAVTSAASSAVSGAASGAASGVTDLSLSGGLLIGGAIALGLLVLMVVVKK